MKRFLLIDDHEVVRGGVKNVLLHLDKSNEISEAADEKTAIMKLKESQYDLIIMDIQIPGTDTAGLLEYIKNSYPLSKVLMFSMSIESIYAKRYLKCGAMGFVSKNAGLGELKRAIELVLNNRRYISAALADQLAAEIGVKEHDNPFQNLSTREFDIAAYLIKGNSPLEIADLLNISISTIGTYKSRLFEKLNVSNMSQLIELARLYKVS